METPGTARSFHNRRERLWIRPQKTLGIVLKRGWEYLENSWFVVASGNEVTSGKTLMSTCETSTRMQQPEVLQMRDACTRGH